MLSGHSIIYFGPGKWDGMWRNRHQLMTRFARYNKVMYVEPVVYFNRVRHQLLYRGPLERKETFRLAKQNRRVKGPNNLYIYRSPVFLPISGRFPFDRVSWWAWISLLKLTMRKLGFQTPIIWLSQPHMAHLVGSFNEKLSIYHVVDEYLAYEGMNTEKRKRLEASERQLLEKVDLVMVVSNKLFKTKGSLNNHTYVVPNGVDYASYNRALLSSDPLPSDIARLPKPIIGYSGLISRRLDLDLLEHIAIKNPEWSLVLIGEVNDSGCENELIRLRALKNVYFLGSKDIELVPYYVKAFDVCFIPYAINEETENLSPLKLFDFMATGKPIVTTAFPAALEFKDIIYISESKGSCIRCIEEALLEPRDAFYDARRNIASLNTWEHRVNLLSNLIESRL